MIEAIIQFFYDKIHVHHSYRYRAGFDEYQLFHIPIGNILVYYGDKNIIHDITDDRIIKL